MQAITEVKVIGMLAVYGLGASEWRRGIKLWYKRVKN